MPDYVRVTVNGRKVTVSRAHAENAGLTVLDEPAVDAMGQPLPETRSNGRRVKTSTTVDQAAAKRTTTKKTTARKRAAKKSTSGGSTASTQEA